MALGSALKDEARLLRHRAVEAKVEGKTVTVDDDVSAWFRARLELPAAPESDGPGSSRRRAVKSPTLLYGLRDREGEAIEITFRDRVEVRSAQLGTAVYQVTGNPAPIRKKRSLVGWEASLQRVDDAASQ